jgi:hypothetical protein
MHSRSARGLALDRLGRTLAARGGAPPSYGVSVADFNRERATLEAAVAVREMLASSHARNASGRRVCL